MAIRKKTVKKSLKTSKHVKLRKVKITRRPAAKAVKKAAKPTQVKKVVRKKVVKSKKPAAKTVAPSVKTTTSKVIAKITTPIKKILTAEGWKRMMMKNPKPPKH